MKKHKSVDKISNLTVNLVYFALGVSFTTFSFAGYNLVNDYQYVEGVEFENINGLSDENIDDEFYPTRYEEIVDNPSIYEYSGMALEHEYEDYIKDLCNKYAFQYNLDNKELFKTTLVIGDQESNGTWDCNGKISPTEDYGEFQINISNHEAIEEEFGYTTEELLNDKEKNAEAAIWIISNIMLSDCCKTKEDVYGMYNGWINWQDKDVSVQYVDGCLEREDIYFPEYKYLAKR